MKILINNLELHVYCVIEHLYPKNFGLEIITYRNEISCTVESKLYIKLLNKLNNINLGNYVELLISRTGPIKENIITRTGSCCRPYLYIISEDIISEFKKSNYIIDFKSPPVCFSKDYNFERIMYEEKLGEKILEKIKEELDRA